MDKLEEEKMFEEVYKETHTKRLREMATRWNPKNDGGKWPMWIKIGSGYHGDGQSEHGIPHAHFESKDGFTGVFSLQDESPPEKYTDVNVIEGDIPSQWLKTIVLWANEKSKSYPDYTNWYVARDDWNVNR